MRSNWKDPEGPMPYPKAKVTNISGETKKRIQALRGPHCGTSEHDVIKTALTLLESSIRALRLDTATEIPPACQQTGQS